MLFLLEWPGGINLVLFGVFLLIGVFGIALAFSAREFALCLAAGVHATAGALTVLAGDLITLLISWELLTFSAYAIIRRGRVPVRALVRTDEGRLSGAPLSFEGGAPDRAAYRYLAAQICAAALFFVAIVIHAGQTGSTALGAVDVAAQPFMLFAILIKTAMMPLHGWLVGSYTRAGYVGSFILSAFATKVGVYTAARTVAFSFQGTPLVSYIGAVVAVVAVLFALAQHSARRLLSYHIISQVGYMLVGVGLAGTGDGSAAAVTAGLFHSVNHIIYKALLFLVVVVVADYFGHDDLRRMGGLTRSLPLLFVCGVVGAAAITGLPFTSGYASKELLKKSAGEFQSVLLIVASVGTGLSFTKFIYLIFLRSPQPGRFAGDRSSHSGAQGTPRMVTPASVVAIVLALLSIVLGVFPALVPGVPSYDYYNLDSVIAGVLPALGALALWFLVRTRLIGRSEEEGGAPVVWRSLLAMARPVLAVLRGAHRIDAQLAVGIAVAGAVALSVALVLL